jgi:hypothetical protein
MLFAHLLLVALALFGQTAAARADDWSDCKLGTSPSRIAACTRLI